MKAYRTSKDYKRLKELLDQGYHIITIKGKCVTLVWKEGNLYSFECCGISNLIQYCKTYDIEFIEPNRPKNEMKKNRNEQTKV